MISARHREQEPVPGPKTLLDLVITAPGSLAAVTIRKVERLHMPVPAVETQYGDLIAQVRQLPHRGPVSREIWYYNRYGTWRLIRQDKGDLPMEPVLNIFDRRSPVPEIRPDSPVFS
jgi:hypothetical protein